jgi:DNA-binding NarL/FixJ family response regulator
MKNSFLLISDQDEPAWAAVLKEALDPFGHLNIVREGEAEAEILRARHDLIIIDAAAINQPARLVSRLLALRPELRIAVAAAAPEWQETRNVLRAGAVDYFRRSPNKEELHFTIRDILVSLSLIAPWSQLIDADIGELS